MELDTSNIQFTSEMVAQIVAGNQWTESSQQSNRREL
jgi:hypothetical protein